MLQDANKLKRESNAFYVSCDGTLLSVKDLLCFNQFCMYILLYFVYAQRKCHLCVIVAMRQTLLIKGWQKNVKSLTLKGSKP